LAEQLVLALAEAEPPSFANFVAGPNAEALAALAEAAAARAPVSIVLWGGEGTGKTHLLRAFAAASGGRYVAAASGLDADIDASAVAIDDVDRSDARGQARLFTLYNAIRARGGAFVATLRTPPARVALRDDLRTRLAWGLTFELRALADQDKPAALIAHARQLGLTLGDDVIAYLLAHGRRDMRTLLSTLAALDRHSLSTHRAITVPLLRDWMARQSAPPARGEDAG
jgi:DnaA family protein